MTPNDSQIREQLRAQIQTVAPLAVVFPRWELGYNPVEWPGLLRSPNDDGKAHGWVITRRRNSGKKNHRRCVDRDWAYAIWGFHYYLTGNDATNSEDLFSAECDAVADTLDKDLELALPKLQLIEAVDFQFDLFGFGSEMLHLAQGVLVVRPCC